MKRFILLALLATLYASGTKAQKDQSGYPITPVPFTAVKVAPSSFWGQRLQASRDVTIPLAFSKCESEHRYDNFLQAAEHIKDSSKTFQVTTGFPFDDTDPYKTLEGAAYLMQTHPNAIINGEPIDKYCDRVIGIIASAQEPDGYLYTVRTMNPEKPHSWSGAKRWVAVEDGSHELYNLGHLCEAAVAHYNATGKRNLLDIAIRFADCVCREIGPKPGQANVVPGHQIAEMGLAKLYIATGDRKYLEQAKYFLDQRGTVNPAWQNIGGGGYRDAEGYVHRTNQYSQSYKPVTEQAEAVGHAVRAGYMYAGMADVAALTGDTAYFNAIDRIWGNIVGKKYYLTGGVGACGDGERFGDDYELPNLTAYCETCAAIAQVYLFYRLFLLHGESKYYDVLERTLYNGVISGISIDGGRFFYPNPLESNGGYERQPWFGCACCPSNAARFIPSLPQYIYAVKDKSLYINLFASNETTVSVSGKAVSLKQETNYPWDGDVAITIQKAPVPFALKIRIPGWVRGEVVPSDLYRFDDGKQLGYSVKVNGENVNSELQNGYFVIDRKWKKGDCVELHFDMEPRLVRANEKVEADRGRAAIERGPLVYCAEWPDNTCDVLNVLLNQKPRITQGNKKIAQTDIVTLTTQAQSFSFGEDGRLQTKDETLTLIPYYAWAHRGKGHMAIWIPTALSAMK
ncbi:MAG: glycoside hydrolase family 127 protein [Bacteroidaceae bacterium]|nr:glycoside hydrolase family 127 protein [Bacteroidaceae bacterium]